MLWTDQRAVPGTYICQCLRPSWSQIAGNLNPTLKPERAGGHGTLRAERAALSPKPPTVEYRFGACHSGGAFGAYTDATGGLLARPCCVPP